MVEEPLQLMSVERWAEIEEVFKADWPRGLTGITVLERQRYLMERGFDYGFRLYCPYGDVNNGIVAMNIKKTYYEVIIQCPKDDTSKLEEALCATNVLDWTREIEVPFAQKNVMDCIRRIIIKKNYVISNIVTTITYILDKSSDLFDVELPGEFSFELLSPEHVDLIDSSWPYRYPDSDFFFELLIMARMGFGLFQAGKLKAWVFIQESGPVLHLYTLQEERRKGYGELVLKLISNLIRRDGKYVVAYCVVGNENAIKLYEKLNFETLMDVDWCTITPNV